MLTKPAKKIIYIFTYITKNAYLYCKHKKKEKNIIECKGHL